MNKNLFLPILAFVAACFGGCATASFPTPAQVTAPTPLQNNSGKYMAPYTSDGVVAEWVDKAVKAKMGAAIGANVGAYAGQKALEQVPFIGGFIGEKAGKAIGREIAVKSSGGWEAIKGSSDLSFETVDDLAVWMYAKYSTNEHYANVLSATQGIYPDLAERYHHAIQIAAQKGGGKTEADRKS
jgi:hypothetical protein